jgi:hypothetical protein
MHQALAPTLIIVRAGLRGSLSSSTLTPVKGSVNESDPLPPSRRNSNRDMESRRARRGGRETTTIVHAKMATEIRLDDLVQVSAAFFSGEALTIT